MRHKYDITILVKGAETAFPYALFNDRIRRVIEDALWTFENLDIEIKPSITGGTEND